MYYDEQARSPKGAIPRYYVMLLEPLFTLWFAIRQKTVPIFTDWNGAKDK